MYLCERIADVTQLVSGAHGLRQRVGKVFGKLGEHLLHDLGDLPGRKSFGCAVDRNDPAALRRIEHGGRHLRSVGADKELAAENISAAFYKHFGNIGIVEERHPESAAFFVHRPCGIQRFAAS